MILLLAMTLSFLVALLRGGKLAHLSRISIRYGWLAILAFSIQTTVIYSSKPRVEALASWKSLVIPISYCIICFIAIINLKLPGMGFITVGLVLNTLVMAINGGFMPVTLEALHRAGLGHMALGVQDGARVMASKDVILSREATRLWFLSDVFVLGEPFPLGTVFSVGDLFLMFGVGFLLQRTMCLRPPQNNLPS